MKLVEEFTQSKSGNMDLCEDAYFCNEHFAAVIDGATSVSDRLYNGKTQGRLAAELIREAMSTLDGKETINEIVTVINKEYKALYEALKLEEEVLEYPYLRPSASMIIYSKYHHKVWMVGDCQLYYGNKLYQNIKHIDEVFSEVRSIILQGELLNGKTVEELLDGEDTGFQLIRPLIKKQYNFQNTTPKCDLSYAVVNGFPIPSELIKTIDLPEGLEFLSLASDGYPTILDSLEASEEELTRILKNDPLCIHENRSTKGIAKENLSFDDRTYIKVQII
ncbi:hypothetical protein [Paucisalibacillus sp. EB02]|uniref:hypothetical protein n=1 Tax=Paucisalibacillus sp. EB02 TaxID=1347087 RepID=UPI0004B9B2BD|nr:hypothetical protein [Paucisalibacillus sp. EB02]